MKLLFLCTLALSCFAVDTAQAQQPNRRQLQSAQQSLRRASQLYGNQDFKAAGEVVAKLIDQTKTWKPPKDQRLAQQYTALRRGIQRARTALIDKGVEMPGGATRPRTPPTRTRPTPEAMADEVEAMPDRVSFAKQIVPILVERCMDCHNADDSSGGLSIASFGRLARGGNRGAPFDAGPANMSLLVQKLKGTADGGQMPPDDPLSGDEIELFETWISQGATNDAGSDRTELTALAAEMRLASASAEELSAERRKKAMENWKLAFPSKAPLSVETANFLVMGAEDAGRLEQVGQQAERVRDRILSTLKVKDEQFRVKGRITLIVLPRIFDLNEFALMVEGRNLPRPVRHEFWKVQGADAYVVCKLAPDVSPEELQLARALTGIQLEGRGGFPGWFVDGLAEVVAVKLAPRGSDEYGITNPGGLLASLSKPNDFLRERTSADVVAAASYSFIQFLQKSDRQFADLLLKVDRNAAFVDGIKAIYGESLDELVKQWWSRSKNNGRRRPR